MILWNIHGKILLMFNIGCNIIEINYTNVNKYVYNIKIEKLMFFYFFLLIYFKNNK